jgi:hypothetical protein
LNANERVIVNGLQRAIPGREVSPEMQEAATPAAVNRATAGG